MRNQIIILAAGKGTRMGGSMPKVLVMLKNKPMILYLLEEVGKINQLIKPVVVVGYKAESVKAVLGEDYFYALQNEQLGTAHALLAAKKYIKGENILVLYGDMPLIKAESLKKLMRLHQQKKSNISMFTSTVPSFKDIYGPLQQAGRVIRDSKKKIVKIIENKDASTGQKKIKEINAGVYMFNTKWLFEHGKKITNKNVQLEYYLTDIVEVAILHGEEVQALSIDPKEVIGVNSQDDLKTAEKLLF
jgi:bifunctional UDP-N-acetylglucosamine pyrophosphorylase/glucosamine-1-phosphate N-acetyltransferase